MRKIALIAAALGLAAAPVAAQSTRTIAPVDGESELAGPGLILGAMGVAAVIATIILVTEGDDDVDLSVSP